MRWIVYIALLCFSLGSLKAQSILTRFTHEAGNWYQGASGFPAGGEKGYALKTWSVLQTNPSVCSGLLFSGKNYSDQLFMYIFCEVDQLMPNSNYTLVFNALIGQCAPLEAPLIIKVGAKMNQPTQSDSGFVNTNIRKGDFGRDGRDMIVLGKINTNDETISQYNLHNYERPFSVNTDDKGKLYLIFGIEPQGREIIHTYLQMLRVVLTENGDARELSNISASKVHFYPNANHTLIFFETEYDNDIHMLNIYTNDGHLMRVYTFENSMADRAFRVSDLPQGEYRIEFVLRDHRTINKSYTVR